MTQPIGPSRIANAKKVVKMLSGLLQSLPTAADKREIYDSLKAVTSYLEEAQTQLESIPIKEDFKQLDEALQRLEKLLNLAEDSPLLSKPMGLRPKRPTVVRPGPAIPNERVTTILKELEDMTIDQIRVALTSNPKYSTNELRALGKQLGLRLQARVGRETLANHIATSLANTRGYKELSGDTSTSQ